MKVWKAWVQSSGSTGFRGRFWITSGRLRRFQRRSGEALVQCQVRFNRVPEQGPERSSSTWYRARPDSKGFRTGEGSGKVPGGFGAGEGSSGWLRSTLQKDL